MKIPGRSFFRYGLAVVAVGLALAAYNMLTQWLGPGLPQFITFYPAVMLVALAGGLGPGIVATLATALAVNYWLISPVESFSIVRAVDLVSLSLFTCVGVLLSVICELYRRMPSRLEKLVGERTRELRESEGRLKILYESMSEGIAYHTMIYEDGNAVDYVITSVNPAFEEITGITRSRATGIKASELYGTGKPPNLDIYARVASCGIAEQFETFFPLLRKHVAVSVFSPEKGNFATTLFDITERKMAEAKEKEYNAEMQRHIAQIQSSNAALNDSRKAALNLMEDALESSQYAEHLNERLSAELIERRRIGEELQRNVDELAAANNELKSFSYSISHDLRAPLRAMKGFSSILRMDYADKLDAIGSDFLARIVAGADRMNALIDDMLSLSKISRQEMNRQEIDLSAIACSVLRELRQTEPQRTVEAFIAPGLKATGDERLMHMAMFNLIGNAWKYTSKKHRAEIEFGFIEQNDATVSYFIRDNGAGFDMNHVQKIFKPFQRLHAESQFPGTGVGLAIVNRIILRHDGRIWAESETDKGATFYFTLGDGHSNHIPAAGLQRSES